MCALNLCGYVSRYTAVKVAGALAVLLCGTIASPAIADTADGAAARPLTAADATLGKPLYLRECSACHGERGRGDGPAAAFIDPLPRNFTTGRFKFRSTASGQPPTTADVLRIIERGIPGTAMPSFAFLSVVERKQIAAYVLQIADMLDTAEPKVDVDTSTPPPQTAESVARGRQFYVDAECGKCHGDAGKGDGPSAADLKDTDGRPTKARNLAIDPFRGGAERAEVYARMATGLDGTPMPAYGGAIDPPDLWALTDYVLSLRLAPAPTLRPSDPIAAGRLVAEKYSCRGCHVLDDGKGGDVGPDLRVSGQKLDSHWVRAFLKNPRQFGTIYPWRVQRMPPLGLTDDEVSVMSTYLAAMGKRHEGPVVQPDAAGFPANKVTEGQLIFMLRCTECHNFGNVIAIPAAKQQGPDLINVPRRVDYEWAKSWILNPKKIDPKTRMVVPDITPEQVEAVRMFVWKNAMQAENVTTQPVAASAQRPPG